MRHIVFVPIFLTLMSFSQCDRDAFDKKAPVDFTKIYYQDWVGGRPGSEGTIVTLIAKQPVQELLFDSIYFDKKVAKMEALTVNGELRLSANFIKRSQKDNDLILSSDPKEEFGNQPSKASAKIPFELADNEAVISYVINGKKRYFRLKKIQKAKTLYYP